MSKDILRLAAVKEFKGDALAKFLAVHIFNEQKDIHGVCNNYTFSIAGQRLRLKPFYRGINDRTKAFANAYEIRLWEVYQKQGLEEAMVFFKNTALVAYKESYSIR